MSYFDSKGEYILRKRITTKNGKVIFAKPGSAFKIYINRKK